MPISNFVRTVRGDIEAVFERDPAARSVPEVVLCYPGFHATVLHRAAHWLWGRGFLLTARLVSHASRFLTGIEIHPGARIGKRFFIDHGMGVVIGETAEIGDNVTLYHGVTLGGTNWSKEKRHPTLENGVVVGAGAKILGAVTIGANSKIGSGSVVVRSVPPHSTVVGIPGRVVFVGGGSGAQAALDHGNLPDIEGRAIQALVDQVMDLEKKIAVIEQERAERSVGDAYAPSKPPSEKPSE